jgi:hypothetical protein
MQSTAKAKIPYPRAIFAAYNLCQVFQVRLMKLGWMSMGQWEIPTRSHEGKRPCEGRFPSCHPHLLFELRNSWAVLCTPCTLLFFFNRFNNSRNFCPVGAWLRCTPPVILTKPPSSKPRPLPSPLAFKGATGAVHALPNELFPKVTALGRFLHWRTCLKRPLR